MCLLTAKKVKIATEISPGYFKMFGNMKYVMDDVQYDPSELGLHDMRKIFKCDYFDFDIAIAI